MASKYTRKLVVYSLAVAAAAASLACFQLMNEDIGWQVRTGDRMYASGELVFPDAFTYTARDEIYLPTHWLFYLAVSPLRRVGGVAALVLFKMALAATLGALIFLGLHRNRAPPTVAFVLTLIVLLLVRERLLARPHLVSFVLFAGQLWLLAGTELRVRRRHFVLPLLFALAINVHVGAVFALPPLGFWCLAVLMRHPRRWRPPVMLVGLCLSALFVSPLSPDHLVYLFKHVDLHGELQIFELAHAWPPASRPGFWVFALGALGVALADRLRADRWQLAAALTALACAIWAVRLIPYALMVTAFCMAGPLRRLGAPGLPRLLGPLAPLLLLATAAWPLWYTAGDNFRPGFGWNERSFPVGAADFLDRIGFEGRIANENAFGGYLIVRGWPRWQVESDGRMQIMADVLSRGLQERIERWAPDAILLATSPGLGRDEAMLRGLRRDWELVYVDQAAWLLLRKDGPYQQIVAQFGAPHVSQPLLRDGAIVFETLVLNGQSPASATRAFEREIEKLLGPP